MHNGIAMTEPERGCVVNRATSGEGARVRRVLAFARRRVAAFSALALAVAGVALLPTACSSSVDGTMQSFDAAPPPPPGPCVLTPTAVAVCEAGPASDAGDTSDAEALDGGSPVDAALDATGPVVAPASQNLCLVTQDVTLACPSAVASIGIATGAQGASDVLVTQRGLAYYANPQVAAISNDDRAYLQIVHLDGRGNAAVTMDPVPPYSTKDPAAAGVALLNGAATHEASLLSYSSTDGGAIGVRAGLLVSGVAPALGAAFEVPPASVIGSFVSRSGEGFLTARPNGGTSDAPLVLVRGLPEAPRSVTTSVPGSQLIIGTTDPTGAPAGLFADRSTNTVRLLEGEGFTKERWSSGSRDGAIDLVYVEEAAGPVPAVLLGALGSGGATAYFARTATSDGSSYAVLGSSYSTCSRSTYVGVTCDACPVSEECETGNDDLRNARLFTRAGRLFAVYYSTDVRHRMGYSLDKTPILGLGCVCALHERDTREYADSLVVVEIVAPSDPKNPPTVVEYMRLPLYKARSTGFVQLAPRDDGDVDVLLGPASAGFESALTKLPDTPTPLRVLRISTKSIP